MESRRRVVSGRRALKGEARRGVTPSSHSIEGCEVCEVHEVPATRMTGAYEAQQCVDHARGF